MQLLNYPFVGPIAAGYGASATHCGGEKSAECGKRCYSLAGEEAIRL
jgi:hypothetical protein